MSVSSSWISSTASPSGIDVSSSISGALRSSGRGVGNTCSTPSRSRTVIVARSLPGRSTTRSGVIDITTLPTYQAKSRRCAGMPRMPRAGGYLVSSCWRRWRSNQAGVISTATAARPLNWTPPANSTTLGSRCTAAALSINAKVEVTTGTLSTTYGVTAHTFGCPDRMT